MAARTLPDAELLRQLFAYNPDTGEIVHRARSRDLFTSNRAWAVWNSRYAGQPAASQKDGYMRIIVFNRQYKTHRIVYKMHFGVDPPAELDHVNGNGRDNRIANLRPATSRQNKINQKLRKDSTTGVKGVSPVGSKFRATVKVNGRQLHLGRFKTIEEAAEARRAAERTHYREFVRSYEYSPAGNSK